MDKRRPIKANKVELKKWTGNKKRYTVQKSWGDTNMKPVMNNNTNYKKGDRKKFEKAMRMCSKQYKKALDNLAK